MAKDSKRYTLSKTRQNIALGLLALIVVMLGFYTFRPAQVPAASPPPKPSTSSSPTAEQSKSLTVGILSDSHAYNAGSWWRQTVAAGKVEGIQAGEAASTPGVNTAKLLPDVKRATEDADFVLIQAGTNDLLSAKTPAQVLAGIGDLADAVSDAGPEPLIVSIPPSATRPEAVAEANGLLAGYAADKGYGWLDVTSAVEGSPGGWAEDLSGDGVHANKSGSDLMAKAAAKQLPKLIAD